MSSLLRLRKTSGKKLVGIGVIYFFLGLAALYFLMPLVVVLMTSFKTMDEIRAGTIFTLPHAVDFTAWKTAWFSACTGLECKGLQVGFRNSVMITIPSVVLSILVGAITGFALSQHKGRLSAWLLGSLLLGAFIPYQILLYPLVKILSTIGIYATLPGIVIIHIALGLPYVSILFYNFYAGLPNELVKAAKMDGAGFFRIFFDIIFPMSLNAVIVAVIMQATGIWNDFLLGLTFAGSDNFPMTVQLNNVVNTTTGIRQYNVNMAATVLTALPPLALYILAGRYFARGLSAGAVKG
ncbi:Inner membrane ABC transporter permease protein YcjP [Agrobacterium sp. DSM 25558]|uniref:carbohydrate ABC transporter permease n=1 Tax=Agrobacterium sp. DSM 25558 TaxID=1907665 RepID=UPI0009724AFE|nr:carbohydrate ABC transporter permease [Agrobacterium sp. DSM 25558]SCX23108.1 Inner membrane ABC transporter permease protein YcjP [Agrobacterium sp. DSM 25558]